MNNYDRIYFYIVLSRLKPIVNFIINNKYWCTISAIFYAILCLLLYSSSEGIPIPISFLKSPELIISLMVIAFFFPIALFILIFLPNVLTAVSSTLLDYELFEKIYVEKSDCYSKSNIGRFFQSVGLSLCLVFFIYYIQIFLWSEFIPPPLYLIAIIASITYSAYKTKKYDEEPKNNVIGAVLMYNLAFLFWQFLSLFILSKLATIYISKWPGWTFHPLFTFTAFILMFFCYTLSFPSINTVPKLFQAGVLTILPTISLVLFLPANVYCYSFTLKFFKLGGGYKESYYIDSKDKKYLPDDIFEPKKLKGKDLLKTKKLSIILRTKDKTFIRIKYEKSHDRVIEINNSIIRFVEHFN